MEYEYAQLQGNAYTVHYGTRGEKGDAFKYEDFTKEQLEALRGPSGKPFSIVKMYPSKFEMDAEFPYTTVRDGEYVGIRLSDDVVAVYIKTPTEFEFFVNFGSIQGEQGPAGMDGRPGMSASIMIGNVTEGDTARVQNMGTPVDAVLDFTIPKGKDGKSATVSVGTVSEGDVASVTNRGTENDAILDFTLKGGKDGKTPLKGVDYWTPSDKAEINAESQRYIDAHPAKDGADGRSATIKVGTVTSGPTVSVTNSGTETDAVFDFVLPSESGGETIVLDSAMSDTSTNAVQNKVIKQYVDSKALQGKDATIAVGSVTEGSTASVTNVGTPSEAVFDFVIPKAKDGVDGKDGLNGKSATVSVGTVTSGEKASITNTGDPNNAVLHFVLPKGDKGDRGLQGESGPAGADGKNGETPIILVGNVTEGETASVVNSGTLSAAIFDFVLPKGKDGVNGADGQNGLDGKTPQRGVDYWTPSDIAQINAESQQYIDAHPAKDGVDGQSATIAVGTVTEGSVASVTNSGTAQEAKFDFVLPKAKDGVDGQAGIDGKTPVRGVDYWTAEDVAQINAETQAYVDTHPAKVTAITPEEIQAMITNAPSV